MPMFVGPRLCDFQLADRLIQPARRLYRNGKLFNAVCGLDAIAIVPMTL